MSHDSPQTLVVTFTPTAPSDGEEEIYEVSEGEAFIAEEIRVYVNDDPDADLDIELMNGNVRVAPKNQALTVTETNMVVRAGTRYDVGDSIVLKWTTGTNWTGDEVEVLVNGRDVSRGIN